MTGEKLCLKPEHMPAHMPTDESCNLCGGRILRFQPADEDLELPGDELGITVNTADLTRTPPRGYSPLSHTTNGGVTAYLHQQLCLRCGAVVADRERHDKWHGVMDK